MEILDKSKIEFINEHFNNVKEKLIKIFSQKPTESVGIYIADNYIYYVSIFYDSSNWHILSFDKEEIALYDYEEEAANWIKNAIKRDKLNNAIITLAPPNRILLKHELQLNDVPKENLSDVIYWDFVANYFEDNQKFNIAYYPVDNELYCVAAMEEKHQKYLEKIFNKKDIVITNWVMIPSQIALNLHSSHISVFDKNISVSSDIDMQRLNEYTPAIYAAMIGAKLSDDTHNITFSSLSHTDLWNYKSICLTLITLWILFLGGIFFYDSYKIYSLQEELTMTKTELQKLSIDRTKIDIYNYIINDTKMREAVIAEKTKNRVPYTGAILHLGIFTAEGVVINSVKSDGNKIIIEGEAIDEEYMQNFFDKIAERKDIFIKSPKSLKIDNKDKIKFSFSINL